MMMLDLILHPLYYSPVISECTDTESAGSTMNIMHTVDTEAPDNAGNILKEIRIKNLNRILIGTHNINSLSTKFEQLKMLIADYLGILVIQETKLVPNFPEIQILIDGYKKPPYRMDRNRQGGVFLYTSREDLFIEISLRKTKLLLFGTYHSTHPLSMG